MGILFILLIWNVGKIIPRMLVVILHVVICVIAIIMWIVRNCFSKKRIKLAEIDTLYFSRIQTQVTLGM